MANVANVKVLAGNQVQVSGAAAQLTGSGASVTVSSSQVVVTGALSASGDVFIAGKLTAREYYTQIVTSSVIYESGSTKFGDTSDDTHEFTGSVNIDGLVSSSVGFSGSAAGLTGLVKSVVAGPNISASAPDVNGAVTVRLSSSITSDLTTLTGLTNLSSSTGSFAVLSASAAEFSGNVLIYGTASLSSNPTAAYVRYVVSSGSVADKIVVFPGIYTDGQVTASLFSGSGAGLTNLPASNLSGVIPLANGGTGINASGVTSGQLLIGSGSTLQLGDLVAGSNVGITKGSGSITINVTGSLGVSQVTGGANISASISGNSLTVALSQSVTGLTNLESAVISGSTVIVTGSLIASSSFARTRVTLDTTTVTSYDVTSRDQVIIVNFESDDDMNINLPSATQLDGRELIIKRGNANQLLQRINVVPSGSETIDLTSSLDIFGPFESKTLIADSGSNNWVIV
jgi:hypothetical protein